MKFWKVGIVVEVAIIARTKTAAIEEALKIPLQDLEHQPITAKVLKQITHIKHLPDGYCKDDLVWVADDSLNIISPDMADCEAALMLETEIKKGLRKENLYLKEALE